MKNELYDYGYGRIWKNVRVIERKGYNTSVADFHEHDFYEINIILSGNVRILLSDRAEEGKGSFLVLTKPDTPHFVSCEPDTLYSRLYLVFSRSFIENYVHEWSKLSRVFGDNGRILRLTDEQLELCQSITRQIHEEKSPFRQRLMILCLLSHIDELSDTGETKSTVVPPYIIEALTYIDGHYHEKLTAEMLSDRLHTGRTTLMTSFKRYTGSTLNDYIIHCRLKNVIRLIGNGVTEQEAAEECGFGDASGLIRTFKRKFGVTPKQYLSVKQ